MAIKVLYKGKEKYLNDLLIELDYYDTMVVEVEDTKFELNSDDAQEFIEEYGQDQYSQCAVAAAKSVKAMRECAYACGFVKEKKGE